MQMTHLPRRAGLRSGQHGSSRCCCFVFRTSHMHNMSIPMHHPKIHPVADSIRGAHPEINITLNKLQVAYNTARGLLTGFGLDFLAEHLSGPTVDSATLQLVGVLFSSILLPGLASGLVTQQQKKCQKAKGLHG
eukprot:1784374-Amphidinium_carterae.1